jgi:hypothetical protein
MRAAVHQGVSIAMRSTETTDTTDTTHTDGAARTRTRGHRIRVALRAVFGGAEPTGPAPAGPKRHGLKATTQIEEDMP